MHSPRRWSAAVLALSALALAAHGATIKFDQSQTGDYNLQIHLKNIELYAVFDDSGSSDDDYGELPDYTDPTESSSKPTAEAITSTPKTPSSSTAETVVAASPSPSSSSPLQSAALLDPYSPSNNDKIVQMVEALIASNGNTSDPPSEPLAVQQQTATASSPSPSSSTSPSPSPYPSASPSLSAAAAAASSTANRKCGPGYFRDPMGRCRRIRKPHLPFLQMVHTPGVIKSFQPQQRTSDDVSASKN